jgi:hypothetical protein
MRRRSPGGGLAPGLDDAGDAFASAEGGDLRAQAERVPLPAEGVRGSGTARRTVSKGGCISRRNYSRPLDALVVYKGECLYGTLLLLGRAPAPELVRLAAGLVFRGVPRVLLVRAVRKRGVARVVRGETRTRGRGSVRVVRVRRGARGRAGRVRVHGRVRAVQGHAVVLAVAAAVAVQRHALVLDVVLVVGIARQLGRGPALREREQPEVGVVRLAGVVDVDLVLVLRGAAGRVRRVEEVCDVGGFGCALPVGVRVAVGGGQRGGVGVEVGDGVAE